MQWSGKKVALITSGLVLLTSLLPAETPWASLSACIAVAMAGFGLFYPLALNDSSKDALPQRGMQDIEVGPATTAILF
ncbi:MULTISPECIES: hypothetical protein [unclassified Herbaspirillum]|jgi:hypothetical protein|uniref:hypothetical protein n=1 Tax=unclassified Herbaspirillum TaxID=2624150 RepID=UPI000E2E5831|nr:MULTISPECIES: hypothetical protein [unclassified Herbaspirillum]RFB74100.1 hypothetical protein DZB54_07545 [Herbaspirillum sp. 3R-3a1]TFI10085.1 hypothetical protein E4P32_00620 [Herbaspirillum sp. 3R11]TFI15989.1 hypothetical protein E4P31_00620 [Herbaspirillum sp. 3R-11]TFI21373.1 hypothetical protein E4P30_20770 [Herbaspirillum sp. 3C11]